MVVVKRIIAYVELVVYAPTLIACAYVVFKHGWRRQLGWIYLAIFCAIRLAGAGFQIEAISHPTNVTDIEWATILQSVGLSPLLLASMGLLKRICDQVSDTLPSGALPGPKILFGKATAASKRSKLLQIMLLPCTIALILCISGGTDLASSNPSDVKSGHTETKAGIAIFLVIYVLIVFLFVITFPDTHKAPQSERKIMYAILLALPFIAVRLLYSVLSDFTHNTTFSFVNGKWIVQLCMATIMEFIVVVLYTIVGLKVGKYVAKNTTLEMGNQQDPAYFSAPPQQYAQQQAYAPPRQQDQYFVAAPGQQDPYFVAPPQNMPPTYIPDGNQRRFDKHHNKSRRNY